MEERKRLEQEDGKDSAKRRSPRLLRGTGRQKQEGTTVVNTDDGKDSTPVQQTSAKKGGTAKRLTRPRTTDRGPFDVELPNSSPRGRHKKSILLCVEKDKQGPNDNAEVEPIARSLDFEKESLARTKDHQSVRKLPSLSVSLPRKPVPKPTIRRTPEEERNGKRAGTLDVPAEDPAIQLDPSEEPGSPVASAEESVSLVPPTEEHVRPVRPAGEPTCIETTVATTEEASASDPKAGTAPDLKSGTRETSPQAQSGPLFDGQMFEKKRESEERKAQREGAKLDEQLSPTAVDTSGEEMKPNITTEEIVLDEGRAASPQPHLPRVEEEIIEEDNEIQIVENPRRKSKGDDTDGMSSGREGRAQKRKREEEEEVDSANHGESGDGSETGVDEEDNSQERVFFDVDHVSRIFEHFLAKRGIVLLAYNGITDEILEKEVVPKLDNLLLLQEVRLNRNILSKLPDNFQPTCRRARCLRLTSNRIPKLPKWFSEVCSLPLKQLFLQSNDMEELPLDMDKLRYLEVLDVSNNRLKEIPVGIGELRRMKVLNLSNNDLTSLPHDLGAENEKLLCLDVSDNEQFFAPLPDLLERRAYSMENLFIQATKLNTILRKKERDVSTSEFIIFLSSLTPDEMEQRLEQRLVNEKRRSLRSSIS